VLKRLKEADARQREKILARVDIKEGFLGQLENEKDDQDKSSPSTGRCANVVKNDSSDSGSEDEYDVSTFLSLDDKGKIKIYGPSSSLHTGSPSVGTPTKCRITETDAYQLIANAALSRQKEHHLRQRPTIGGIPGELALHLLDLHWNRAHHTFLLTYRPAIMRDLLHGGPYCSEFLLNAIFAITSKYSDRVEIRSDRTDPSTAGAMFFQKCEELIANQQLLYQSSIPTICALVILGGTFNATGHSSKGWLYTGYALRMVYDLGLHLDSQEIAGSVEDLEIRRRVFWGAFICDKLMSLYFGRPVTIQLKDAHVSRSFLDTYEEMELWQPYDDAAIGSWKSHGGTTPVPVYSVSTFQRLCSLSKIMARIMNRIYRLGATAISAGPHLTNIDQSLETWYNTLPSHLAFEPWKQHGETQSAAPNVIGLLTTYNACVILLHRPFISCGHLRATSIPSNSWKRCNVAARNITSLVTAYRNLYGLRRASYLLAYAVYVACTIHARSPATGPNTEGGRSLLTISLKYLDELEVANSGVASQARVIRRLMEANNISAVDAGKDIWYETWLPKSAIDPALQFPADPNFTSPNFTEFQDCAGFPTFDTNTHDIDLLFGFMDSTMPHLSAS